MTRHKLPHHVCQYAAFGTYISIKSRKISNFFFFFLIAPFAIFSACPTDGAERARHKDAMTGAEAARRARGPPILLLAPPCKCYLARRRNAGRARRPPRSGPLCRLPLAQPVHRLAPNPIPQSPVPVPLCPSEKPISSPGPAASPLDWDLEAGGSISFCYHCYYSHVPFWFITKGTIFIQINKLCSCLTHSESSKTILLLQYQSVWSNRETDF